MRLRRLGDLTLAQRELFRVRLQRSVRIAFLFGVSMGLAYVPNGVFDLAHPGDPWWTPIVMGVTNGAFMFAIQFFAVGRIRGLYKDEQILELEELAREEKDSQVSG